MLDICFIFSAIIIVIVEIVCLNFALKSTYFFSFYCLQLCYSLLNVSVRVTYMAVY